MNPIPFRFGLMPVVTGPMQLPRTMLPLKSVRYRFAAKAGIAEVEMTQVYRQENAQPLDCEYLFPLPADAAVYRCEAEVEGRIIEARIEERDAARLMAEARKAEGYRTALVESERDNLFTLSLGNLQPQDVVEIRLTYLQPLRREGGKVALDLPLSPGVRYIPGNALLRSNLGRGIADDTDQVPDASRVTPPRIDADHRDAAFVALDGCIEACRVDGNVDSPTHKLRVSAQEETIRVVLASGGEVPDRDLALRWNERRSNQAAQRGWTSRHNGMDYALLELSAPDIAEPAGAIGQDLYFLVDRSGSMEGLKWQKAIHALHGCVSVLKTLDRVSVTLFESNFSDFDASPQPAATLISDPRFQRLESIGTAGGTEIKGALVHVMGLVSRFSKDRPAALVLITDAQVANDRDIVSLMLKHPSVPVHCFGIDSRLNDSLLIDLVRQQGGTFHALQPTEDVSGFVTRLGRMLGQPVFVDLKAPAGWEPTSGTLPNLYAGQINLVSLRKSGSQAGDAVQVLARGRQNEPVSLEFPLTAVNEPFPWLRWCKERLVTLVAREDRTAAVALSKEANLLCPLTAFVAWDRREKVAIARHALVQPNIELGARYASGVSALPHDLILRRTVRGPGDVRRIGSVEASILSACDSNCAFESGAGVVPNDLTEFLEAIEVIKVPPQFEALLNRIRMYVDSTLPPNLAGPAKHDLDECQKYLELWKHVERIIREATPVQRAAMAALANISSQLHATLRQKIREVLITRVSPSWGGTTRP